MSILSIFPLTSQSESSTASLKEAEAESPPQRICDPRADSKVVDLLNEHSFAHPGFSQEQRDKFSKMELDQFISKKYIAHLFGDSFLEDSLHEGWFIGDGLVHMIQVLKDNLISSEMKQVLLDLEKCFNWQGRFMSVLSIQENREELFEQGEVVRDEICAEIQGLAQGQKVLFPGGYKGHSVLYEIKRIGEDQYNFTLYNTGDGTHKHWMLVEKDGVHKTQAAYRITDVKLEKAGDPDFIGKLLLLKTECVDNFGEELYEKILPLLEGKREAAPIHPREYMVSQRAGTCVWKMLCAYVRYNVPLLQYKYLKLKARLDVFDKWQQLGHSLDFNKTNQRLLNRIVVNYERLIYRKQALPLEFSRKELLALGLLKVQKTFNEYKFLLSEDEITKAEECFSSLTGHSIYEDNGYIIRKEFEIGDKHSHVSDQPLLG